MNPPSIASSTRQERLNYVLNEWKCLHNCELCGKCHVLKGRNETQLYADYIEGKRPYMEITLEIRNTGRWGTDKGRTGTSCDRMDGMDGKADG